VTPEKDLCTFYFVAEPPAIKILGNIWFAREKIPLTLGVDVLRSSIMNHLGKDDVTNKVLFSSIGLLVSTIVSSKSKATILNEENDQAIDNDSLGSFKTPQGLPHASKDEDSKSN